MKKTIVIFLSAFLSLVSSSHASTIKGIHVDGFITILGDQQKEDSLLNYAQFNGVNYLALYDVFQVHTSASLTNTISAQPFADFIKKAKQNFKIKEVGVIGENFWFFNTIIDVYNQQHPDTMEQVDVYSLEFAFWNTVFVNPGGVLCTTYLTPNALPCDTNGAFSFYISQLTQINALANSSGRTSETFLSFFNQQQGDTISKSVDRVLLTNYISNYSTVYTQVKQRLEFLASGLTSIDVVPMMNADLSFLSSWLDTSVMIEPYIDIKDSLFTEPGTWKQYINLSGVQWFSYSMLPHNIGLSAPSDYKDTVKGFYVDGFITILGNIPKEDSLLTFAQDSGYNYIALYDLFPINAITPLTNVITAQPLAAFINKAKTTYNISHVGAVAENFEFFRDVINVYNQQHSDTLEKFDVYNVEFEFWNTNLTTPGASYCNDYLIPNGLSCDETGAFKYYKSVLTKVDSLANANNVISETYVGWFNQIQAVQFNNLIDRIMLHIYVNNYNNIYSISQQRFEYLASACIEINTIPIFSAEPNFLGPWLTTNSLDQPCNDVQDSVLMDAGMWNQYINIIGCQWFAYSFMPPFPAVSISENGLNEYAVIVYPNPANEFIEITITNQSAIINKATIVSYTGQYTNELKTAADRIKFNVQEIPPGVYTLRLEMTNGLVVTKKIVIVH